MIPLTLRDEVEPQDLGRYLGLEANEEDALALVLALDEAQASMTFTMRLYAALGDAIRSEEAGDGLLYTDVHEEDVTLADLEGK